MKTTLEQSLFRTVKNEIEAKISGLDLEHVEPHVKLEDWDNFCDAIRVYITPKGDVDCSCTCYSNSEEKELKKRLDEISEIVLQVSDKYKLAMSNFDRKLGYSYRLIRRKTQ